MGKKEEKNIEVVSKEKVKVLFNIYAKYNEHVVKIGDVLEIDKAHAIEFEKDGVVKIIN